MGAPRLISGAALALTLVGCAATPSSSQTTEEPTPSTSMIATPTETMSPSLAPTIAPRTGWTIHPVIDSPDPNALISGVAEARGQLFALGSAGFEHPGIWASSDGVSWTPAATPKSASRFGFRIRALVDAGSRLVAIGPGGFSEGSGLFATAILTSVDGVRWETVEKTPGIDPLSHASAHFGLVKVGSRLIAVGHDVWVSDDDGLIWSVAATREQISGTMFSVTERDGLIVAVGEAGGGDVIGPPAIVWLSSDQGATWSRSELPQGSTASGVTFGRDAKLVAVGMKDNGGMAWVSADQGQSWVPVPLEGCCPSDIAGTPSGYVVVSFTLGVGGDAGIAWTSLDGASWTSNPLEFGSSSIEWTPSFSLLATARPLSVALAPYPFP